MKQIKYKYPFYIYLLIPIIGILISLTYINSRTNNSFNISVIYTSLSILITSGIWLGCYCIVVLLWKMFPWEQSPIKHLLLEIAAITFYITLFGLLCFKLMNHLKLDTHYYSYKDLVSNDGMSTLLITYLITTIHEAVFFYKQWKFNFSKSAKLEKDNIKAKYEILKSQVNPHFLFNSLNSLSGLVENNTIAIDYIQNLSKFLRYTLKGNNDELSYIDKELDVLNKYINIQKLRFNNNLIVEINVEKSFYKYSLPPLALQILVENCIKHNIITKTHPLKIKVYVKDMAIVVENNLQKKSYDTFTGSGLINIQERLSFFTTKELAITKTTESFIVELPLLKIDKQ